MHNVLEATSNYVWAYLKCGGHGKMSCGAQTVEYTERPGQRLKGKPAVGSPGVPDGRSCWVGNNPRTVGMGS